MCESILNKDNEVIPTYSFMISWIVLKNYHVVVDVVNSSSARAFHPACSAHIFRHRRQARFVLPICTAFEIFRGVPSQFTHNRISGAPISWCIFPDKLVQISRCYHPLELFYWVRCESTNWPEITWNYLPLIIKATIISWVLF